MRNMSIVLTCLLVWAGVSQAEVFTLSPIADSYIRISDTASSSHGAEVYMVSNNGSSSGKTRWSYVKFDLSDIHKPIIGAKLEIQAEKAGGSFTLPFDVYGLITGENWSEAGLNWTNAPARLNSAVDLAGVYGGVALSTFTYAGAVSGNAGGPVAAAIDQLAGGAAGDFINADSDKIVTFIIARKYGDTLSDAGAAWATKESTYSSVAKPVLTVYAGVVAHPDPSDGQGLATDQASPFYAPVPVSQVLSWQAASDPNIDTSYTPQYKFFMDTDKIKVETGVTDCQHYHTFLPGASYNPASDLAYGTTYYWRVDTMLKWDHKTDPNTYPGDVWEFKTASARPIILTDSVNTKVAEHETAQFTVTYSSANPVTSVTWYKGANSLTPGGDISVTPLNNTTSTLSIADAETADEDSYYCVITSTPGGPTSSIPAQLVLKKLLARYEFELNLHDSAGTNHGTLQGPVGGLLYQSDTPEAFPDPSHSADPNGGVYSLLSTAAYPRAGLGNGLEEGTICFWFKAGETETGYILGSYNTGTKTALHIGIGTDGNPGKVHTNIRDEDGGPAFSSGTTINDNEWHHAALILTPTGFILYTDVVDEVTRTGTMDTYADWQYPIVLMARNLRGVIGGNFSGMVDDLQIYNYAWTQLDVAQEYYRGKNIHSCVTPYASSYDFADAATGLTIGDAGFVPDCKIDLADFAAFAQNAWMSCGLYPLQTCN